MKYNDMDDGQNFICWATGVPPQEHLEDIGYKKHSSSQIYEKVIRMLGNPSDKLKSILRKIRIR